MRPRQRPQRGARLQLRQLHAARLLLLNRRDPRPQRAPAKGCSSGMYNQFVIMKAELTQVLPICQQLMIKPQVQQVCHHLISMLNLSSTQAQPTRRQLSRFLSIYVRTRLWHHVCHVLPQYLVTQMTYCII